MDRQGYVSVMRGFAVLLALVIGGTYFAVQANSAKEQTNQQEMVCKPDRSQEQMNCFVSDNP